MKTLEGCRICSAVYAGSRHICFLPLYTASYCLSRAWENISGSVVWKSMRRSECRGFNCHQKTTTVKKKKLTIPGYRVGRYWVVA